MKALVTGASGFVGAHLARRLTRDGHRVATLVRPGSHRGDLPPIAAIHVHDGSVAGLKAIVEAAEPDVVFHLAALFVDRHQPQDIERLLAANVLFSTQLADAMARCGVRHLVNTGTSWQHDADGAGRPVTLYAATKQAFESILTYYVDAHEMSVITLKLFDTYGPCDRRGKLLTRLAGMARTGESLAMSPGEQLLDIVHVDDVVDAFVAAADRLLDGKVSGLEDYAVSSGDPLPLRSVIELFSKVAGRPIGIDWGARPYRFREVMVPWRTGPAVPGWRPRIGLEDGFRQLLAESGGAAA
ncbi:MAG: NAD-dependent epimerase/dehydratase family protein [Alphaproteobacteria bacterium]|nr:NAD-dependent epimerase/dehydratase family protein [Alphaproteobacteria bacterium]